MSENIKKKEKSTLQQIVNYVLVPGLSLLSIALIILIFKYESRITKANADVTRVYTIMYEQEEKIKELESTTSKVATKYYNFTNGNYTVGEDLEAGVYNIVAVKGFGNVSTSDYELNAIMGTKNDDTLGMAEQEYNNVVFNDGTVLKIDGVDIRLKRVK